SRSNAAMSNPLRTYSLLTDCCRARCTRRALVATTLGPGADNFGANRRAVGGRSSVDDSSEHLFEMPDPDRRVGRHFSNCTPTSHVSPKDRHEINPSRRPRHPAHWATG